MMGRKTLSPSASTSNSSTTLIFAGIVLGSSITLIASYVFQRVLQSNPRDDATQTPGKAPLSTPPNLSVATSRSLPAEIRDEQLSRHTLYFGADGMRCLQQSRVCVVGLGGVGSHVAVMLARGGVGYLRLVDFDQVSLSSLNRHACAVLSNVGTPKATCLAHYLRQICPDPQYLRVDPRVEMYTNETARRLLDYDNDDNGVADTLLQWDIVIDAIDDVPTKASLIAHCLSRNIRVLSCMGAACKADMTRLHVSDLKTAAKDPLASKLRKQLKTILSATSNTTNGTNVVSDDYLENMDRLAIVFSSEKPTTKLADFTTQQLEEGVHEFGAVDNMRIRVLPVLGTMPASMGQALAALALTELGRKPILHPVTGERVGRQARHKIYRRIKHREDVLTKDILTRNAETVLQDSFPQVGQMVDNIWIGPIQIDMDDVEFLMEIWRNRCAVTGARLGVVLELIRWDLSRPSSCDNLVLMSVVEINKFVAGNYAKTHIPEQVQRRIQERLLYCRLE